MPLLQVSDIIDLDPSSRAERRGLRKISLVGIWRTRWSRPLCRGGGYPGVVLVGVKAAFVVNVT